MTAGEDQPLLIRQGTVADIERLTLFLAELFAIEADFSVDLAKQREGLQLLLKQKQATLLVAEVACELAGMVSGQLLLSTAEGGWSLLVEDLFVQEKFRGHGLGRQLLDNLLTWAAGRGATRAQLLADSGNVAALEFYQHSGWRQTRMIALCQYI